MSKIYVLIFSLFFMSCEKYTDDSDIDTPQQIGRSVFFKNGVPSNWDTSFWWDTFSRRPIIALVNLEMNGLISNVLAFSNFNASMLGKQKIQEDSQTFDDGVYPSFFQTIDEDQIGYEYEPQGSERNLFELLSFDTIQKTIDFKFRVHFKRSKKNDNKLSTDEEWPKFLKFEGHFHDYYK